MATYSQLAPTTVLRPDDTLTLGLGGQVVTPPGGGTDGGTGTGTGGGTTDPGTGGTDTGGGTDTPTPPATTVAAALTDALASLSIERATRLAALATAQMTPDARGPRDLAAAQLVYVDRAIDETIRAGVIAQVLAANP